MLSDCERAGTVYRAVRTSASIGDVKISTVGEGRRVYLRRRPVLGVGVFVPIALAVLLTSFLTTPIGRSRAGKLSR